MKTNMLFWCISVAFVLLLSSCATIFNRKHTEVSVYTNQPFQLSHDNATFGSKQTGYREKGHVVKFHPERSKDSLRFSIHNETDTATYKLKPKLSSTLFGNAITYGLGLIVDFMNKKRFTYPGNINLTAIENPFDQQQVPQKLETSFAKPRKGMITLNLGFPTLNFISTYSNLYKKQHEDFAFFGISLGADYYYRDKRFFNFTTGLTSYAAFFGCGNSWYEEQRDFYVQSLYFNLTHNHRMLYDRLSLGYGLSYGINWWNEEHYLPIVNINEDPDTSQIINIEHVEKRHVLGFAFNAYFMPGESFFTGIDYRPTIFRFQRYNKFRYEHLISLTFGWKIKLKRGT